MEFSVRKCSILIVVRNNPSHSYSLKDTPISMSRCERNLGVLLNCGLPMFKCWDGLELHIWRDNNFILTTLMNAENLNVMGLLRMY